MERENSLFMLAIFHLRFRQGLRYLIIIKFCDFLNRVFTAYCEQLVLQFVPGTMVSVPFLSLPVTLSKTTQAHKT